MRNEYAHISHIINEKIPDLYRFIIKCCRENGVKEFTIASNSMRMIRAIMALEAYGCYLNGTAMVNRDNLRIDAEQIPAFKIEIL